MYIVVYCCSLTKSYLCLTLWGTMDSTCGIPGSSVLQYLQTLLGIMSIELVILSNHLILCCSFLLLPSIFPSIRVFPHELALCIRWPKYGIQHTCFQYAHIIYYYRYMLIYAQEGFRVIHTKLVLLLISGQVRKGARRSMTDEHRLWLHVAYHLATKSLLRKSLLISLSDMRQCYSGFRSW